jgi:AraC-like DNA-binding protein
MNTKLNHNPDWPKLAKQANWSVTKLASFCKVSPRTLERHFRRSTGKSPKEWLAEQRQRQALELLRDGSSVKETASLLGYSHAHHFSREFKERWGYSPRVADTPRT